MKLLRIVHTAATHGLAITVNSILFFCIGLSLIAALVVPFYRYALRGEFSWVAGALVYTVFWCLLYLVMRRHPVIRERSLVIKIIAFSMVVKVFFALAVPILPFNTDQAIFRSVVDHLVVHGLGDESMRELGEVNDYALWVTRAFPVHYILRLAGDDLQPWVVRFANILASTAILGLIARLAYRFLPPGSRAGAVFLMAALPLHLFIITDFSHHLYSALYLLAGTVCAVEIRRCGGAARPMLLFSLGLACLLFMLMLQRGVHMMALAGWAVIALLPVNKNAGESVPVLHAVIFILVVPLMLAIPAFQWCDQWFSRHAPPGSYGSSLPGFVARGWCPESGGEYVRRFEQIEKATPVVDRASTMWRLVGSEMRHNTSQVCFALPFIKTAKLFLVGYASNIEESLAIMESSLLTPIRGVRLAGTILFLAPVLLGIYSLLKSGPRVNSAWIPVSIVVAVTWVSFGILGETSPRYSVYCQPFLALLGARGLACFRRDRLQAIDTNSRWMISFLPGPSLLIVFTSLLALMTNLLPSRYFFQDLKKNWADSKGVTSVDAVGAGEYHPFEARIAYSSSGAEAFWMIPDDLKGPSRVLFFILDVPAECRDAEIRIRSSEGYVLFKRHLSNWASERLVAFDSPGGSDSLGFDFQGCFSNETMHAESGILIGYLRIEPVH